MREPIHAHKLGDLGGAVWRSTAMLAPWESPASPAAPVVESPLLTVAEAAKVVPLSVKQLYRVAARADGPFRKVEGRQMAYESELHRWIKEHPAGTAKSQPPVAGDSLADRVRRRREGSAS